jgi:hypothetical protein
LRRTFLRYKFPNYTDKEIKEFIEYEKYSYILCHNKDNIEKLNIEIPSNFFPKKLDIYEKFMSVDLNTEYAPFTKNVYYCNLQEY